MRFIENYKSIKDEIFGIFVNEYLEKPAGDFEGLHFVIIPAVNKGGQWNCLVRISGTLQAVWGLGRNNNSKDIYDSLFEIGVFKVKQAIEESEPFLEYMFNTYTSQESFQNEKNKLHEILELSHKRKALIKKNEKCNLAEIFSRNIELRWKVLKICYELSNGNSWNFIMHQDVAKILEIDTKDELLFGIYKFLEDKGFLKPETNVEYSITSDGLEEVENGFPALLNTSQFPSFKDEPLRISVDDIDSFNKVKMVATSEIKNLCPLEYSEEQIQLWLEEIIGEPEHKKDWGGEINDLFTTQLLVNIKRKNAAFLLKGPGINTITLEISRCGKKGDQIQRLFRSPAELFLIQFIGLISENIIEEARNKTLLLRHEGINAQFCIIDGYDTARILKAYGKIIAQ